MYFCFSEFELGVNDSIFSGNEQQKVYLPGPFLKILKLCCSQPIGVENNFKENHDNEVFKIV